MFYTLFQWLSIPQVQAKYIVNLNLKQRTTPNLIYRQLFCVLLHQSNNNYIVFFCNQYSSESYCAIRHYVVITNTITEVILTYRKSHVSNTRIQVQSRLLSREQL